MSGQAPLLVSVEGAVGFLTFNVPARHNAVSRSMWEAIPELVRSLEADARVRVVVLRGAGERAFISGADVSEMDAERALPDAQERYDRVAQAAWEAISHCHKPTVARIQGYCLGAGVATALACDLRYASEDARFGIPAAKLGLGYPWRGMVGLVQTLGPLVTRELFFTARQFSAAEALQMGLINRVLPVGELDAYVARTCEQISENAPLTLAAVKGTISEMGRAHGAWDEARIAALAAAARDSEDAEEGRRAFAERRPPVFKGR